MGAVAFAEVVNLYRLSGREICFAEARTATEANAESWIARPLRNEQSSFRFAEVEHCEMRRRDTPSKKL